MIAGQSVHTRTAAWVPIRAGRIDYRISAPITRRFGTRRSNALLWPSKQRFELGVVVNGPDDEVPSRAMQRGGERS